MAPKAQYRQDEALLIADGPYGPLRKHLGVEGMDGIIQLPYLCPLALLCALADRLPQFTQFILAHVAGLKSGFAIYLDEVAPGNQLRPGTGRGYTALYWTLLDLPDWFRSSKWGWFHLMFIPTAVASRIKDGFSAVLGALLETLWSTGGICDLEGGGVRMKSGQDSWSMVRIAFSCFIADERAIKDLSMAKGASARKPCVRCANILGRIDPTSPLGDYRLHFTSPMRERFDFWTSARLEEAADHLALMRGRLTRTNVPTLEMHLGLPYGFGQGILFRQAKSNARFPGTIFWDSMHTLYASGGVAQYERNQYILAIRGVGIPWAQLEDFKNKFVFCPGRGHLKKFILEERIVNGNGSHLRGFASEVLMLVKMLSVFGHLALSPMGLLVRETRCIYLLDRLGDFLKLGRLNPQQAFARIFEHHNLFVSLYPGCAKPTIHYI